MRPLYALTGELEALMESADDDEQFALRLAGLEGEIEQKAAGIATVLASLKAEEMTVGSEVERLKARLKRTEKARDKLTEYVRTNMERMGATKLQGGTFTFAIQQNPESVVVLDESLVPDEMKRTVSTTTVDKRAVLDAYRKHGEVCPGTDVTRTSRLVIK